MCTSRPVALVSRQDYATEGLCPKHDNYVRGVLLVGVDGYRLSRAILIKWLTRMLQAGQAGEEGRAFAARLEQRGLVAIP